MTFAATDFGLRDGDAMLAARGIDLNAREQSEKRFADARAQNKVRTRIGK